MSAALYTQCAEPCVNKREQPETWATATRFIKGRQSVHTCGCKRPWRCFDLVLFCIVTSRSWIPLADPLFSLLLLQVSAFVVPRRRILQTPSSCAWTTCCWRRAWPGQRKAADPQLLQLRRWPRAGPQTTPSNILTTEPNSPRSDRSTTQSWRNMSR